jgi:hypothetical protein
MKISIITWDASFRESFHTVDSFGEQKYSGKDYEFIWADYYENRTQDLVSKVNQYPNFRILNLGNNSEDQWHLGKILNEGIKQSKGDVLIIPDGDVVVSDEFLLKVEDIFNRESGDDFVCYFRRWDEPEGSSGENSRDILHLKEACRLNNPTNYAGCFAIRRSAFEKFGFFEEHEVFSGPGANGLEQYLRFRNHGMKIMWSDLPIYHPHHSFSGSSDKKCDKIFEAAKSNPWIQPYMGLKQSWVIRMRELDLSWKANDSSIDVYLSQLSPIDSYIDARVHSGLAARVRRWIQKLFK